MAFDTRFTDSDDGSGQHYDQHYSGDDEKSPEEAAAGISTKANEAAVSSSAPSVLENPLVLSILVTETAERVAYYGFRAVSVLYFVDALEYDDATAVSLFAATTSLAYFSPLVGAIVADSAWGRFSTIWRFGCLYFFGLVVLTGASCKAVRDQQNNDNDSGLFVARFATLVGFLFVCTGTGGIKPCVSAFGADQVVLTNETTAVAATTPANQQRGSASPASAATAEREEEERVREYFNAFYFCINIGALASFLFVPMVRARWGFGAAFLFPAVCMFLALGVFRSQKNNFRHRSSRHSGDDPAFSEILLLCLGILRERFVRRTKLGSFLASIFPWLQESSSQYSRISPPPSIHAPTHGEIQHGGDGNHHSVGASFFGDDPPQEQQQAEGRCHYLSQKTTKVHDDASQALHVLPVMLFFPVFWMLYDQQGSVWTLQATRLDMHGFQPEQLQVLNPLEIMVFIPFFDRIVYPFCQRRGIVDIRPIRRMEHGMFLASVSFFASAYLEHRIQQHPDNSISVLWQIPQITILAVAEILLSVTGLEFAYGQAPPSMQTLVLALYLFTTTIGDALGALLYATVFATMDVVASMVVCAVCLLVNLAFFAFVVGRWEPYKRSLGEEGPLPDDDGSGESGVLEFSYQRTKGAREIETERDM